MFYKNVLFVFPMFYYGFFSVFSGTPIYDNYLYQFFNLFFTGAPIMWFGIMDFEYSRSSFMKKHKYYKIGFNDEMFNKAVFWRWIVYGIWQGALIYFVGFYSMQYADPDNGSASSELVEGQFVYLGVVTLANLKIVTSTSNFNFWTFFFSISQTLAFVLFFFLLNLIPSYTLVGLFRQVFNNAVTYFALLFVSGALVLVDNGLHLAQHEIKKFIEIQDREREKRKKEQQEKDHSVMRRRVTNFQRKNALF